MKTWDEVTATPEFQALPPNDKAMARDQYFNEVVAPKVPEAERGAAKAQFVEYSTPSIAAKPPDAPNAGAAPADDDSPMTMDKAMANIAAHRDKVQGQIGQAVTNLPSSAWNYAKGMANAVAHPVDTATELAKTAGGLVYQGGVAMQHPQQALMNAGRFIMDKPTKPIEGDIAPSDLAQYKPYADALLNRAQAIRHDPMEEFSKDPVGVLADVSGAASLGGAKRFAEAVDPARMVTGPIAGAVGAAKSGVQRVIAPNANKPETLARAQATIDEFKAAGMKPEPANLGENVGLARFLNSMPLSSSAIESLRNTNIAQLIQQRQNLINAAGPPEIISEIGAKIQERVGNWLETKSGLKESEIANAKADISGKLGLGASNVEAGAAIQAGWEGVAKSLKGEQDAAWEEYRGERGSHARDKVVLSVEARAAADEIFRSEMESSHPDPQMLLTVRPYLTDKALKGLDEGQKRFFINNEKELKGYLEDNPNVGNLSIEGAERDISKLKAGIRSKSKEFGNTDREVRRAETIMAGHLQEAIDQHFDKIGKPELSQLQKAARDKSVKYNEVIEQDKFGIMKSSPDDVANKIIRDGKVSTARAVKGVLGPEGLETIKQSLISKMMERATSDGVLDGKKLNRMWEGLTSETREEIFTPQQRADWEGFVKKVRETDIQYSPKSADELTRFAHAVMKRNNPGEIAPWILEGGQTRRVAMAQQLLPPDVLREIKRYAIEDVLKKSGDPSMPGSERVLGRSSANALKDQEAPLRTLLGDKNYNEIKGIADKGINLDDVTRADNPSKSGKATGWQRALEAFKHSPKAAVTTLGVPYVLSKIYLSDAALDRWTRAYKLPDTAQYNKIRQDYVNQAINIAVRNEDITKDAGDSK